METSADAEFRVVDNHPDYKTDPLFQAIGETFQRTIGERPIVRLVWGNVLNIFDSEFENNLMDEDEDIKKMKEKEEQTKRERAEMVRVTYEKKGARVTRLPEIGVLTLEEMKELVREVRGVQYRKIFSVFLCWIYAGRHAGLYCNKLEARVPWKSLGETRHEFVSPEYLPEGYPIEDPS